VGNAEVPSQHKNESYFRELSGEDIDFDFSKNEFPQGPCELCYKTRTPNEEREHGNEQDHGNRR
jgi:hypothetical protein